VDDFAAAEAAVAAADDGHVMIEPAVVEVV
jgi:hypothetical protein